MYLGGRSVRVGGKVGGGESRSVTVRRVGRLLRGDIRVDGVEGLRQGAVHVEPPVTDQILLVEHCTLTTECLLTDQDDNKKSFLRLLKFERQGILV